MNTPPKIEEVQKFWDENPLCAWTIPFEKGSKAYFEYFDKMRMDIEPEPLSSSLYEFESANGKKVLEVGCGNGFVLSRFASKGALVTGVDITPTGVELCKKRFSLFDLKGEFIVADAQHLPFEDNSFDMICSMGVLHHVPDTEKAVSEIYRVLKPGGRFLIMLYHRNSVLYRFKFPLLKLLTGKSIQQLVNEVDGVGNPKGDVYSEDQMRKLLNKFKNIQLQISLIEGWMIFPKFGKYIPRKLLSLFEKKWGWFLYAKAYK